MEDVWTGGTGTATAETDGAADCGPIGEFAHGRAARHESSQAPSERKVSSLNSPAAAASRNWPSR